MLTGRFRFIGYIVESPATGQRLIDVDSTIIKRAEEQINTVRNMRGNHNPAELKKKLQQLAYFNLLLIRNKDKLSRFLRDVESLSNEFRAGVSVTRPQDLIDALELRNLLSLAEIEANVCMERTESRGPHYREDFPLQDDANWLKSITAKKIDGRLRLGTVALHLGWQSLGDEKVKDWG
jgi:succinate dehydrogenase/fumarate reductase flavoprotein subunit